MAIASLIIYMTKHTALILTLYGVLCLHTARGQSWTSTKIDEYYSNAPLSKVLSDLKNKYHIPITYDTLTTANEKLTYWFSGTKARAAMPIIFHQIKGFDFKYNADSSVKVVAKEIDPVVDDDADYASESLSESLQQRSMATVSTKYTGSPKKNNVTVSGILKDGMSGEVLPFATIGVRGTSIGTSSNVDGYFTLLHVPSDTAALVIRFVGYEPLVYYLNPNTTLSGVTIHLDASSKQISEVKVVAARNELLKVSDGVGAVSMSPIKVAELPSLGEHDIFRAFQLLPGVSASNEGSAGLSIRGGSPDQNLILFDGFTVYHQDHLFGVFSAFNYNAIKDVKLYKGGFEAKYGGRLSSVMDIVGKNGNERKVNWGGDASLLGIGGFIEVPLAGKGSILVAGRRSYQGLLYDKFFDAYNSTSNTQTLMDKSRPVGLGRNQETVSPTSFFYDLNVKASYRITKRDYLSWSLFNGEDDLDNSRTFDRARGGVSVSGGNTDLSNWGNIGSSLKWSRKWNDALYSNTLVSFSKYYNLRNRSNTRQVMNKDTSFTDGSSETNYLYDYSIKNDNEYKLSDNKQLEYGASASWYKVQYNYQMSSNGSTQDVVNRNDKSFLANCYLQNRISLASRWQLLPGVRTSYYSLAQKAYLEPRFQTTFQLAKPLKLKASWGVYHQFINRVLREDISTGSRDVWILADGSKIPVSQAIHYIAGFSYETPQWLFDVEAYYKNLSGLSEYTMRFKPSFNNTVDYSSLFYTGSGYSKGIDFLLQRKMGRVTGWLGYTLGQSLHNFAIYGDGYFPSAQDITHEFKAVACYTIGRWDFSATWIFATGKPYTAPAGSYTITQPDGTTKSYLVVGSKNGSRYPNYHRLDVSAKYNFLIFGAIKSSVALSVFNVYNHQNIWYKEFSFDETGLTETNAYLLNFTPNLSFTFKRR